MGKSPYLLSPQIAHRSAAYGPRSSLVAKNSVNVTRAVKNSENLDAALPERLIDDQIITKAPDRPRAQSLQVRMPRRAKPAEAGILREKFECCFGRVKEAKTGIQIPLANVYADLIDVRLGTPSDD
jgi:hypothetical protein